MDKKVYKHINLDFQQTSWRESLLIDQSTPGERGILPPRTEAAIEQETAGEVSIPQALRRQKPPRLPELSQPYVLQHYSRLSQMVLGNNVSNNTGLATATMKYSPPLHESLVRLPEVAELHPLQDEDSLQGILEIIYRFAEMLKAISGMDHFSLQPGGGAQAIFSNALVIKRFHQSRGEGETRNEIITTLNSHPANAAAAATAGFKVIHLPPGPKGYPETDALKAAVSENTAGLLTTNPEDIGIFNPFITDWVKTVHDAGALCAYDQANANGIVGITRARDTGFDLCHFNLHKTFSIPHGSYGGGCGALGVRADLQSYLPKPMVTFDGSKYSIDYDRPDSIGSVRAFLGNVQAVVKAYAWIMAHGAEGIRQVAETAVLNNNYLTKKITQIRGASISYPENTDPRIEQTRFSWEQLSKETGIDTEDIRNRVIDFGIQTYWPSHHPYTIPQPFSLEPTESVSKADLDELVEVFDYVANEAYNDPEKIRTAPHRSTTRRLRPDAFANTPITWRKLKARKT